MKNLTLLSATLLLSLATTGCVSRRVVSVGGPRTGSSSGAIRSSDSKKPECHPSQYWDGEKCKHKGKGKGARKHDD